MCGLDLEMAGQKAHSWNVENWKLDVTFTITYNMNIILV